jgi:hypothetical protein
MALPSELTANGLMGWVERFGEEEPMLLEEYFPARPNEGSDNQVRWDIVDLTREVAGFVSYNAPGLQVANTEIQAKSVLAPTVREKKRIPGTYIQWLRAPGSLTQTQGRAAIDRELRSLRNRIRRRQELLRAQCLMGAMTYIIDGVTYTVDTEIPDTHENPGAVDWSDPTADVLNELADWVALIEADGGLAPDTLLVGRNVIGYLLANDAISKMLSDIAKEELRGGMITRLPGVNLDIRVYTRGYVDGTGTYTPYIPADGVVMLASEIAGTAAWTVECRSNDARAGEAQRGLFLHSWEEDEPPAGVWVSAESTAIPVLGNAAAVVYDEDVSEEEE